MAYKVIEATEMQVEPALLSMKSAGRYADCSPWTIRRKIYRGELVGVKFGSKLCIEKSELDRFIAAHRTRRSGK